MPTVAGVSRGPKQQVRQDPRQRSLDGVALRGLDRQNPDMHYVWVGTSGEQIELYETQGYTLCRREKDGVTDVGLGGAKGAVGSPITRYDTVLMAIPKADRARLEREGPDGQSGQSLTDKVEGRIFNRKPRRIPDVTKGLDIIGRESGEPTMVAETIPTQALVGEE
jgi:hypothetical protein